jgi:hypothetical protein
MKTTKHLSQQSRSSGRDLNPRPPEYETGVLTTGPRSSVLNYLRINPKYHEFPHVHVLNIHV